MTSPLVILREATKAYPAANLVWAAIAVAAAVAVISAFNLGIETLTAGGVFILAVIAAFAVVSLFHRMLSQVDKLPGARLLAAVIAWSFTLFLLGFIGGLMTSFFFGIPRELQDLFAALRPISETSTATAVVVSDTLDPVAPGLGSPQASGDLVSPTNPRSVVEIDNAVYQSSATAASELTESCLAAVSLDLSLDQFETEVRACYSPE